MTTGHIYILTNTAVPDILKVGRTNDLSRRLAEHNRGSNVLGKWVLGFSMEVPDDKEAERLALRSLRKWKVAGKSEQFKVGLSAARIEVQVALSRWSDFGRKEQAKRDGAEKQRIEQNRKKRIEQREAGKLAWAAEQQRRMDASRTPEALKASDERVAAMIEANRKRDRRQMLIAAGVVGGLVMLKVVGEFFS